MTDFVRDQVLEELSDRIRMGIPVGIFEAIAVIEYREKMKAARDAATVAKWQRIKPRLIKAAAILIVALAALAAAWWSP